MSKRGAKTSPKEFSSYEQGDIVLGKVRGYPPWPAMIVDPEAVPPQVAQERPAKKAHFYCVQFFPAGDHSWLMAKDISKLQTHEIQSYINEPYKKNGDLLTGYRIALDPSKWKAENRRLSSFDHAQEDDESHSQVDELDSDGGLSKKSKSKKRKRESDVAGRARKPVKPKEADVMRRNTTHGRKNGQKSKSMVESEDEAEGEPDGEDEMGVRKKDSSPLNKRSKREKADEEGDESLMALDSDAIRVREWRHKLQKAFLGKNVPDPTDMDAYDNLFTTVEAYDRMNIQYLQFSKIGKVMRHITVLTDDKVPRDQEFRFRDRAKALVEQWHQILKPSITNGADTLEKERGETVSNDFGHYPEELISNKQDVAAAPATEADDQGGDIDADAVSETPVRDVAMTDA